MRDIITLLEEKSKQQDIEIIPLNFEESSLAPVLSKDTIHLHYDKLAKGYAERYNKGEGDPDFNFAGAFLQQILLGYFEKFVKLFSEILLGSCFNYLLSQF